MTPDAQFYTIVSMFGTFMGGAMWFGIKTARELGALKVTAASNHERIELTTTVMAKQDEDHKEELLKEVQERGEIARHLTDVNNKIFQKLDDIKDITSAIKETCSAHNVRLQHLEKAID